MKVCILGADRLLAVVPNRDPRKTISLAMLSPDGKLAERTGSSKRKSVYNKWNAEDSLSGKCNNYSIIYEKGLGNKTVQDCDFEFLTHSFFL